MARAPLNVSIGWTVVALIASIGGGYAIATRTADVHTQRWFVGALVVAAPLFIASAGALLHPNGDRKDAVFVLLLALFPFPYAMVLFGLSELLSDAADWVGRPDLNRPIAMVVVALCVGAAGLALFYIRLNLRFLYGATEFLAGLAVSTHKVITEGPQLAAISTGWSLALLTAGVYLVVRGLDNMHQGLTKEPLDAGLLWLLQWIPWSSRWDARVALNGIHKGLKARSVEKGSTYRRRCLVFSDPKTKRKTTDFLGREIEVTTRTPFVLRDDDSLVFRLTGVARDRALAVTGAGLWDLLRDGSTLADWVAVPHDTRAHWARLADAALWEASNAA